jgi:hypothetical protein
VASDSFIQADTDTSSLGYSGKIKATAMDAGLCIGYAAAPGSVPYISYGRRQIWTKTDVTQSPNTYDYHQSGTQDIFAIGYEHNSGHLGFQIEGGMNATHWPQTTSYNDGFVAASLAYRWGVVESSSH